MDQTQKLLASTTSPTPSAVSLHEDPEKTSKDSYGSFGMQKQSAAVTSRYAWYQSSETISYGTVLGLFGYCVTHSQFYLSKRGHRLLGNSRFEERSNWSIMLFLWFISRYVEFQTRVYCGQVERRWRVCPLDPTGQSPAWGLCRDGDVQGVLKLFCRGLSPYLKDAAGRSFLNVGDTTRVEFTDTDRLDVCRLHPRIVTLNCVVSSCNMEYGFIPTKPTGNGGNRHCLTFT